MTFPTTQLEVRVDLSLAGAWTDITDDVRIAERVVISRGRADEAGRPDAQTCGLTLDNRDGQYSPRNPLSPYYGVLGRNTPLRVGVGSPPVAAATYTDVDSTSLVAPSVTAEAAGRLFCVWGAAPVGNITGPGGFSMGTERDGSLSTWQRGTKTVSAGATGTSTATHSVTATEQCAASVWVPGAAISITSASSGASSGTTLSFSPTIVAGDTLVAFHGWSSDPDDEMVRPPFLNQKRPGAWVLLADSGPSAGPRIQAWSLYVDAWTAGTVTVSFDALSGIDNFARVEQVAGATPYYPRFTGEVSSWPAAWDLAGTNVTTSIVASGVRRRLGAGSTPLRSAMYRRLLAADGLQAYWPLEDVSGAGSFASAIGGPAMTFRGTPSLAADDRFAASAPLPTLNAAGGYGRVPVHEVTNEFIVGALIYLPTGLTDEATLFTVQATGSAKTWAVKYDSAGPSFRVEAFDADGASVENIAFGAFTLPPLGSAGLLQLRVEDGIPDIDWTLRWSAIDSVGLMVVQDGTGTIAGETVGRVSSVKLGLGDVPLNVDATFGHVFVTNNADTLPTADMDAVNAYVAYPAMIRMRDLCREADVSMSTRSLGSLDLQSELMGAQLPRTFLQLMDEAADADGGVLVEPKGYLGFTYRDRASKLSQLPVFTLDCTVPGHVGWPLTPTDDDQGVVNDVTVTRFGGSSARAELLEGPLSVQPAPDGIGRYDASFDLSLYLDDQAGDRAAWILHLGTIDEARWPTVVTKLEAIPAGIPAVAGLEVGDVITLQGLPAWVPPGPVDLMLEGYTETLGPYSWEFVGNYSPGSAWRAFVLDSATFGRLDSEGATLAEDLTTTETGVDVATATDHALWITTATHPSEFPFDVIVGGELMTVTAIVGATTPQTFTVTRSVNGIVKTHSTGAQVRLAEPIYIA